MYFVIVINIDEIKAINQYFVLVINIEEIQAINQSFRFFSVRTWDPEWNIYFMPKRGTMPNMTHVS